MEMTREQIHKSRSLPICIWDTKTSLLQGWTVRARDNVIPPLKHQITSPFTYQGRHSSHSPSFNINPCPQSTGGFHHRNMVFVCLAFSPILQNPSSFTFPSATSPFSFFPPYQKNNLKELNIPITSIFLFPFTHGPSPSRLEQIALQIAKVQLVSPLNLYQLHFAVSKSIPETSGTLDDSLFTCSSAYDFFPSLHLPPFADILLFSFCSSNAWNPLV